MTTATQIHTLLHPLDEGVAIEHAISILNQTFTSLDQAHVLPESVASAKGTLEEHQSQLSTSQANVDLLIQDTREKAREQLVAAQELSLLRHSLADELGGLSEELTSGEGEGPTLLEEIESLHRKLKELESVREYVQVIHKALELNEKAIATMQQISASALIREASVGDYVALRSLVNSVEKPCQKAKDITKQDVKLVSFLKELLERTWSSMKDALSQKLLSTAEDLSWPMPVDYSKAKPESRKAFEFAFANLLRLQEIGRSISANSKDPKSADTSLDSGLYPLQALIRPVALRFKYHFEGTRQTNRIDKPEWYFSHVLNVTHEHRTFLEAVVQKLVQSTSFREINVWREFTRLLLPLISRKIKRSMPSLLLHPPLLAHTIYQALAFDDGLREAGFSLAGTLDKREDKSSWEGSGDSILDNKVWFDSWLEGERKFAEGQYNEIIHSPDAWQFSDDSEEDAANEQDFRPTVSARRVKAMVEQITDRYRALPRFLHKTRFLINVQVPILELYHTRISESLDAFETLSSFLVRAVPGALAGQVAQGRDPKSMTSGTEGSLRLVKAYVSAKWTAKILASWGEDLFFLELWHEICEKSSLRKRVEDVALLPDPNVRNDEGTIFEELVIQYDKLAKRAENMLLKQICGEIEADLKPHFTRQSTPQALSGDTVISQTLLGPVARLSAHLGLFRKTLPSPVVIGLYRKISESIASHILQRQVLHRSRTRILKQDGQNVLEEAKLWVEACRMSLAGSIRRVEMPWERLLEAGRLLSLTGDAFEQAVNAVRLGDEEEGKKLAEAVDISELSSDEIMQILSVREDFPR